MKIFIFILSLVVGYVSFAGTNDGMPTMGNTEDIIRSYADYTGNTQLREQINQTTGMRLCPNPAGDSAPSEADIRTAESFLKRLVTLCSRVTVRNMEEFAQAELDGTFFQYQFLRINYSLIPTEKLQTLRQAARQKADSLYPSNRESECARRERLRYRPIRQAIKRHVRVISRFDYRCETLSEGQPIPEGEFRDVHPDTNQAYRCRQTAEQWEAELAADPESDDFINEITGQWLSQQQDRITREVRDKFRRELAPHMTNDDFEKLMYTKSNPIRRANFRRYERALTERLVREGIEPRVCYEDMRHSQKPYQKCYDLASNIQEELNGRSQ